jgi:hypothetical protein
MEEQKKKRSFGDVIRGLVLVIALGVFCYSAISC